MYPKMLASRTRGPGLSSGSSVSEPAPCIHTLLEDSHGSSSARALPPSMGEAHKKLLFAQPWLLWTLRGVNLKVEALFLYNSLPFKQNDNKSVQNKSTLILKLEL